MLRKGTGSDAVSRNLKRMKGKQRDDGPGAKLTAKNINKNYSGARVATLPDTVVLEADSDKSIQEQLRDALAANSAKLIDLFREWDDDGNGALDKKELRKALPALGYEAPKKEVDAFFDSIDKDGSGFIEYEEFKKALSDKGIAEAAKAKKAADATKAKETAKKAAAEKSVAKAEGAADGMEVAEGDVAGDGEEDFDVGMRQNLIERDAADADQDGKLDFGEFCQFVRDREEGEFTEEELKKRFDALDNDGSGKIDMFEYIEWALKDALARSSSRVIDLFKAWDEDKSGTVDKKEFHKAINALGFQIEKEVCDSVFDSLDDDKSGAIEYKELATMLKKGVGSEAVKRNLKRMEGKRRDDGPGAKLTAKNINKNYQGSRVAALPDTVVLSADSDISIQEQIRDALNANSAKLIDLFREWDDDGNGAIDKKEMRQAIAALGYQAPKKAIDEFFDSIDKDGSGFIEYDEVKKALSDKGIAEAQKKIEEQAKKEGRELKPRPPKEAKPTGGRARGGQGSMHSGTSLQQLCAFLAMNNVKLFELFREWDSDGNGSLDKKELKKALSTLGYHASKEDIDALFEMIDDSGDGQIDFSEWKRALNSFLKGETPSKRGDADAATAPRSKKTGLKTKGGGGTGDSTPSGEPIPGDIDMDIDAIFEENPGELVVQPRGVHTHTIIMLHPAGATAELYIRLYRRFGGLAVHYRFVFPRAPTRLASWHWAAAAREGGLSCWFLPMLQDQRPDFIQGFYQPKESAMEVEQATAQLQMQTRRMHSIFEREAALLGGDHQRIVLGGTAQGGSLAAHAAVSYRAELGALICCRTVAIERFVKLHPRHQKRSVGGAGEAMPIFIFAGGMDQVHPLTATRETFGKLATDGGYKIEWHVEPQLGHSAESLNEQRYIAYWAARASLGKAKAFDPAAVDALRRLLVTKQREVRSPPPLRPRTAAGGPWRATKKYTDPDASPRPMSALPNTARPESARAGSGRVLPHTHGKALSARAYGNDPDAVFPPVRVHPLLKEPEWRARPQSSGAPNGRRPQPDWDFRPLGGLGPPLGLHAHAPLQPAEAFTQPPPAPQPPADPFPPPPADSQMVAP